MDLTLLKKLCSIRATSGDEQNMSNFILEYIIENKDQWKSPVEIFAGDGFQESIVLVFGRPRLAVFAHLDSVGYAAAYDNRLVKIGGPKAKTGTVLVGKDSKGEISCKLKVSKDKKKDKDGKKKDIFEYEFDRPIDRGTTLTYKPDWREDEESIQCCYLDNRVGVWNALKLCENAENITIAFTTYEEHGGGTAQFIGRFLYKSMTCRQALISDVSLVSEGIKHKDGVVISMRDKGIPRQKFLRHVIALAESSGVQYQLEVEDAGGSDANQIQSSSYPWDWCFIGAAEANYHTPDEKIHKKDLQAMVDLYQYLAKKL